MKLLYGLVFGSLFAFFGWAFSSAPFIAFLDKLTPVQGLIVYYLMMGGCIILLQFFGMRIGNVHFNTPLHTLGSLLILFSFFLILNWESEYIYFMTGTEARSNITVQSEDGAVYYIWRKLTGNKLELSRWLTFVLTPFVLVTIGVWLIFTGTHYTRLRKVVVE